VLILKFEHSGLRSLSESKVSDKDGRNEFWVHFPALRKSEAQTFTKEYHEAEVEIYGTINAYRHGHMSGFAAEINTIEITKRPPRRTEVG